MLGIGILILRVQNLTRTNNVAQQKVDTVTIPVEAKKEYIEEVNSVTQTIFDRLPPAILKMLPTSRLFFLAASPDGTSVKSMVYQDGVFTVNDNSKSHNVEYFHSPDTKKVVFFEQVQSTSSDQTVQSKKVLFKSFVDSAGFPVASAATVIDNSNVLYKQLPTISNNGDVLFVGWDQSRTPAIEAAEDWSLYKTVNENALFLGHGFMPVWISNVEFIFLKNDGLYKMNVDTGSTSRMIATDSERVVKSDERIAISSNGRMIAWMMPSESKIILFEINDVGEYEEKKKYLATGFRIAFSPDGSLLLVQTVRGSAVAVGESLSAKLLFFDTLTTEVASLAVIILDVLSNGPVLMTEWIAKSAY